jgi:hypothetical protein
MATKNLPGGRKVSVNTSKAPSGPRKTKTVIVSFKGKKGSARKK